MERNLPRCLERTSQLIDMQIRLGSDLVFSQYEFFLSIMSMHWVFLLVSIILSSNAIYFNLRDTHKNKSYFISILHVSSSLYIFNSESMLFFIAKSGNMIATRHETSFHFKTSL